MKALWRNYAAGRQSGVATHAAHDGLHVAHGLAVADQKKLDHDLYHYNTAG
jgi:hypothetical protein